MSGIVDLSTPSFFDENEVSVSLDLLNAIASTKLQLHKNVFFLSSIRRGYWDFLIDLEARGTTLSFYDSWNKIIFRPSDKHLLEVNFLYGRDNFDYSNTNQGVVLNSHVSTHDKLYTWLNWKVNLSPNVFKRSTFGYQTLSKQYDFFFKSSISENNFDNTDFSMWSLNEYLEIALNDHHHLSIGGEYRYVTNATAFSETRYSLHESSAADPIIDNFSVDNTLSAHLLGGYGEYTYQKGGLIGKGSLRVSGQSFSERINVAPRLNLRYQILDEFSAGIGYGTFYQPDQFYDFRSELGQSQLADENAKATHYTANFTYDKPKSSIRLDLFYKNYHRLFDDFRFRPTERIETFRTFERSFNAVEGESLGFEILFNHTYGNHSLNINYAYSSSRIRNERGEETSRATEIPHNFSINNIFNFESNFSLSASLIVRSGMPYSEVTSTEGIATLDGLKSVIFYQLGNINNLRYSAYQTFDLRIAKKWVGRKTTIEAYLNFLNLFNTANIRNFYFNGNIQEDGSVWVNQRENIFFPFFVTPGLKVTF